MSNYILYILKDMIQTWCWLTSSLPVKEVPNTTDLFYHRKTSSISRIKSQNLNASCIVLRLSSLNPLKSGVKLRMKM